MLPIAKKLRKLCYSYNALFLVNDDVALAFASDADGVHLGQSDLPVYDARRMLPSHRLIGRSNNSPAEVEASVSLGVDYVAVGAVFPTITAGKGARPAIGLDGIRRTRDTTTLPLVAIGGISEDTAGDVVEAGADCIAVISAVTMADDPETAAQRLVDAIENSRT